MTDYKMNCSDKCFREYVKITVMGESFARTLPLAACAAMLTAIPIMGIIGYVMTQSAVMIGAAIVGVVLLAGMIAFVSIMVNKTSDRLKEVYRQLDGLVCSVGDKNIIVVRDNKPQNVIDWDRIDKPIIGKYAVYLRFKDDMLIILEKDSVLSGTYEETCELLEQKFGKKK